MEEEETSLGQRRTQGIAGTSLKCPRGGTSWLAGVAARQTFPLKCFGINVQMCLQTWVGVRQRSGEWQALLVEAGCDYAEFSSSLKGCQESSRPVVFCGDGLFSFVMIEVTVPHSWLWRRM